MRYLLVTNVILELRKPKPQGGVMTRAAKKIPEESLFTSAVTLGEILSGIKITRTQKPDKAAEIEEWLGDVAET